MERERILQRRLKTLLALFIAGLVLSGATAIPLESEIDLIARLGGAQHLIESSARDAPARAVWLTKVQSAIHDVRAAHPFLFYGTDWLAFGHFVIAIAFLGAWRDPVRNRRRLMLDVDRAAREVAAEDRPGGSHADREEGQAEPPGAAGAGLVFRHDWACHSHERL